MEILKKMIFVAVLILSAFLCLLVANHKKKNSEPQRIKYDSLVTNQKAVIKKQSDTIDILTDKKKSLILKSRISDINVIAKTSRYKKAIASNDTISAVQHIDSALQDLKEYRAETDSALKYSDSIQLIQKSQIAKYEYLLSESKKEISRIDTALHSQREQNVKLYDEVAKLEKKLNRRRKATTIAAGILLTLFYIGSNK